MLRTKPDTAGSNQRFKLQRKRIDVRTPYRSESNDGGGHVLGVNNVNILKLGECGDRERGEHHRRHFRSRRN
jgi:hypothetical protein